MQGPENVTIERFVVEKSSYSESLPKSGVACLCEPLLRPERAPPWQGHTTCCLFRVSCAAVCGLCVVLGVLCCMYVLRFVLNFFWCVVCVLCGLCCVVVRELGCVVLCCVVFCVLCAL